MRFVLRSMPAVGLTFVILGALAGPTPATAELCTIDARPAATLLLPAFTVDLGDPGGVTTLFSVNNASTVPVLAHLTVWSDWSVPVFDFDLYLTGYDVQTLNVRDLLNGVLPQTGPGAALGVAVPGSDPPGPFSDSHVSFPGCNDSSTAGAGPYYEVPAFGETFAAHVAAALTGRPSPLLGTCFGSDRGNDVAVGYITVDVVRECSLLFPSDHSDEQRYFGETGVAGDSNVLWGDVFIVNPDGDLAHGSPLVHVEASPVFENPLLSPSTDGITFYGRYLDRVTEVGLDHREPLPTTFATRYCSGGHFGGQVELIAWRSSESPSASPVPCGTAPVWHPLSQRQWVVFNEDEEVLLVDPDDCVSGDPTCEPEDSVVFPNEVTVRLVEEEPFDFEAGFEFGWTFLDLNHASPGNVYQERAQAWVDVTFGAFGLYQVGYSAIAFDSACDPMGFRSGEF